MISYANRTFHFDISPAFKIPPNIAETEQTATKVNVRTAEAISKSLNVRQTTLTTRTRHWFSWIYK